MGQDRAVCRMPRSPHSQGQAGPAAISAPDYALRLKVFPPHTLSHPVPALLKRFYETYETQCIPVMFLIQKYISSKIILSELCWPIL